jgi:hypothetical protein
MANLIETLYLGCDESHGPALPGQAHPVRFCWATMYSWATVINTVSNVFCTTQLLQQEKAFPGPAKVAVYFTREDHKKKAADSETIYERMIWLFKSMKEPEGGMVVSFYHLPEGREWISIPFFIANIWPTKKQWNPIGTYITIQKTEAGIGGKKQDKVYEEAPLYVERTEQLAKKYGYDIKYIDYTMPYEETLDLLAGSAHHFTYSGSTYYLAACVGTPTTAWSYFGRRYKNGRYYDYDTKENIKVMVEEGQWGKITSDKARLIKWNKERQVVDNGPEPYDVHHVVHHDEVEEVFKTKLM